MLNKGDRFGKLSAAKLNRLDDLIAALDHGGTVPPTLAGDDARDGIVMVRNKSGYARSAGDVVALKEPIFLSDLDRMSRGLEFDGYTPTDGTSSSTNYSGRFGLYLLPCAENAIAPAIVEGITAAKLSMQAATDAFADVYHDDATKLKSGSTGSAQVLWAEPASSYPADVKGVVRLGNTPTPSGQCYFGMAVADIEGYKANKYSAGSYRFAKMNATVDPSAITVESVSDTTKRVIAWNVSQHNQLKDKGAIIWKQPSGEYFAYPWFRQNPNAHVTGIASSGLQVTDWTAGAIDGSNVAATTQAVLGVNKGVFGNSFHGTAMGRLTFTLAASASGVKTGLARVVLGWSGMAAISLGAHEFRYPLVQGPGSDGPNVYDLQFSFSCRLLEGAYLDTATVWISGGISFTDVTSVSCTVDFIANSGFDSPNDGFGS